VTEAERRLREAYDAFNAGGVSAADRYWHPDVEYHDDPRRPGGGVHRGREAVVARLAEVGAQG
jgi:hypothetical protein